MHYKGLHGQLVVANIDLDVRDSFLRRKAAALCVLPAAVLSRGAISVLHAKAETKANIVWWDGMAKSEKLLYLKLN